METVTVHLGIACRLHAELVRVTQDECGLVADSSFNPYVFPNRTITFKQKQKTICKFGLSVDCLSVRLPLSFEIAKSLISKRGSLPLPLSISKNIDRFGCVNCGKCENKANIVMVEGVPLCNLAYSNFVTEDSRCLAFNVTNAEEVKSISMIIQQMAAKIVR